MVKVKPGAKVITIVPAQDVYGNISIVKPVFKIITIQPPAEALSVEEAVKLFSTVGFFLEFILVLDLAASISESVHPLFLKVGCRLLPLRR